MYPGNLLQQPDLVLALPPELPGTSTVCFNQFSKKIKTAQISYNTLSVSRMTLLHCTTNKVPSNWDHYCMKMWQPDYIKQDPIKTSETYD